MRYIELFGGVGGFRKGIEQATSEINRSTPSSRCQLLQGNEQTTKSDNKWQCVWYNDFDKYAVQTYNKNFKESYYPIDITTVRAESIPDHDLLTAGFPCQSFSLAGKRRGFEDTRGTMFFEIARIAKVKRSRYLLLENVKGLVSHDEGRTFTIILETLWELGYEYQFGVVNSKFFGVPQNRERVFIVANLRGMPRPEIFPFREDAEKIPRIPRREKELKSTQLLSIDNKEKNIARTPDANTHKGIDPYGYFEKNGGNLIYDRKGYASKTMGFREKKNICPTLTQKMGTGGNNIPVVLQKSQDFRESGKIRKIAGMCPTSRKDMGDNFPAVISDVAPTNTKSIAWRTRAYKGEGGHFEERADDIANQLTTVQKDSLVIDNISQNKETMGTLTEALGTRQGSSSKQQIRRLTPIEYERLQGFPDNWTQGISDVHRYKQLGNAVTVNVIEFLIKRFIESLKNVSD